MARICENGIYRDMTAEELEKEVGVTTETLPMITEADRLSALESAVADIAMMLMGVASSD